MTTFDDQIELFKAISSRLDEKVECLLIGGSAMLFYGAKKSTKDIDLVLLQKEGFNRLKETLKKLGFREKYFIYKHQKAAEKSLFLEDKEGRRIDLFLKEVVCFNISKTILSRIKEVHEFGNLIVKVIAPEDIILLKCATERAGDRADALELMKKLNIDWGIVINEAAHQTSLGKFVFPVLLDDFLEDLREDFKADIPKEVIKKLRKIAEKQIIDYMKKKKS
ncbi:nucleotidyltransferase [archaeon]|nr:nucleotidyltransferase [archaeon]